MDDRVSHLWQAELFASSTSLHPSPLKSCTGMLWEHDTILTPCAPSQPWYPVVHLLLTCNHTGSDESRAIEPHPLSTANTGYWMRLHQIVEPSLGASGELYRLARAGHKLVPAFTSSCSILITLWIAQEVCGRGCKQGRLGNDSRSSNENVSQLLLHQAAERRCLYVLMRTRPLGQQVCSWTTRPHETSVYRTGFFGAQLTIPGCLDGL